MNFYNVSKIGQLQIDITSKLFKNLEGLNTGIFEIDDWKCIYIESRPFIDIDSYGYFKDFFNEIGETKVSILNYPVVERENYIRLSKMPEYEDFEKVMDEFNFSYVGGICFGGNLDWAIHSDPDNHILFLGFSRELETIVNRIFSNNKYIVTNEKVRELYEDHKRFLEGPTLSQE